jgi:hypothetical protein
LLKKLPTYYQKSKVIRELFKSIELEFKSLSEETVLTENQFFVILSDRDIAKHEQDVGLVPDTAADLETRRGRVMSKLRGTGTVTKTMMKNVAASFVNGDIEIIEYPSRYCFAVKFTSRTGIPYNIEDIKAMVEELKPAHLAVEYIFTYRLWQDVLDTLSNWTTVKSYTWEQLLVFEITNNLTISDDGKVYYCPSSKGNALVIWNENKAYARRNE